MQIVFLFTFTGVNSVTSVLFIEKLGAQPQQLAGLFVVAGLVTALVEGGLAGKLARRYGERRLTMAGLILLAACYLAYLAAVCMAGLGRRTRLGGGQVVER